MSELHYGVNVENLLYDLSQHESDDIGEFDFYCEDEQGREGCATIDITLLAADALKLIASIKAERDALAAENAALKSNLMFWDAEDPESPYDCPEDIANNCGMDFNTEFEVQVAAKMPNRTYRVSEVGQYDCKIELVSGAIPETPATAAYFNPVRAEGIIMFASKQLAAAGDLDSTITLERLMLDAEELAGQLRGSQEAI